MTPPLRTGLLVLHGNRLELLAQAVFAWLRANPLKPLEEEIFLVQSNGMAEWLKMEVASSYGICAATKVELPARFMWRTYRTVLGSGAVPRTSALDKLPLTWRLMRLLPELAAQPGFEPIAAFLGAGDPSRRLQLAQRLADLMDQYQVYRSDWLRDWAGGHDRLRCDPAQALGQAAPVPLDQLWQPAMWRALLKTLSLDAQNSARPALHQRLMHALQTLQTLQTTQTSQTSQTSQTWQTATTDDLDTDTGTNQITNINSNPSLPRRVVLFGTTHIPYQTLEAIAALSAHCQVLMAVPNPCRHHWADIIEGRDRLRAARRRHAPRGGKDLSLVPLQDLHAYGHPLLAAWGRQGRDFVRQLDHFDDVQTALQRFNAPRVDLFDDGPGGHLLEQVQAAIRDLVPLPEHPKAVLADGDRSIVFHVAHSAHREVEILHDQLLDLFAKPTPQPTLNPRDVVVMVPDINTFAPAIRAVFGQHARGQSRYIPWGIADQNNRGHQPLLVALEWLLKAPQQRFGATEVQAILDVPSVARRFGIEAEDLPTLVSWIEGAGVRWGLHLAQRKSLGLAATGEQNTWLFGLRRLLLGYATGALDGTGNDNGDANDGNFAGIEPYTEIAGLSATLAGALAGVVHSLTVWWDDTRSKRSPTAWAERLRRLLADFFEPTDDNDRAVLAALDEAISTWLHACELAGFEEAAVDLAVAREAWLSALDEPSITQRFKAGGVTFCTLLPMRAIPFGVVCLLGMNDGDYPRLSTRSDFDLMALPGQARPGDRSRRDDDRQLMLDALVSARQCLYVSWVGRSQRDNQAQPPSVLVSQLRDYIAAGWSAAAVEQRTTVHPLQPFSRQYFEVGAAKTTPTTPLQPLFTYAAEWRAAHLETTASEGPAHVDQVHVWGETLAETSAANQPIGDNPVVKMTIQELASFLRNPVKAFFKQRLQVSFDKLDGASQDDEPFSSAGLDHWGVLDEVLRESRRQLDAANTGNTQQAAVQVAAVVHHQVARLKRAGRLPMAGPGDMLAAELSQTLMPMVTRWQTTIDQFPVVTPKHALHFVHPENAGLVLDDWLVGLRSDEAGSPDIWVEMQASKVAEAGTKKGAKEDGQDDAKANGEAEKQADKQALVDKHAGQHADKQADKQADKRADKQTDKPTVVLDSAPSSGTSSSTSSSTSSRKSSSKSSSKESKPPSPRPDKLLTAWVRCLASAACGHPARGMVIGRGAAVLVTPPPQAQAAAVLATLMRAYQTGLGGQQPLPTAVLTGLAYLDNPSKARLFYDHDEFSVFPKEGDEACLARLYPDFATLSAQAEFEPATKWLYEPYRAWLDQYVSVETLISEAPEFEQADHAGSPAPASHD